MTLEVHIDMVRSQIIEKLKKLGLPKAALEMGMTTDYLFIVCYRGQYLNSLRGLERFSKVLEVDISPLRQHVREVFSRLVNRIPNQLTPIPDGETSEILSLEGDFKSIIKGGLEIKNFSKLINYATALGVSTNLEQGNL